MMLPPFPALHLQESVGDLMVRDIQLQHSGRYLCAVQTPLESVSAGADVIVRGEGQAAPRWPSRRLSAEAGHMDPYFLSSEAEGVGSKGRDTASAGCL